MASPGDGGKLSFQRDIKPVFRAKDHATARGLPLRSTNSMSGLTRASPLEASFA
jgi:hypothetical protein